MPALAIEPENRFWALETRVTQLEDNQHAIQVLLMANAELLQNILRAISAQQTEMA